MNSAQKKVKSLLYRFNCPPKLELGEYELGVLDIFQTSIIRQHLENCPLCRADLAHVQQFMALPLLETDPVGVRHVEKPSLLEQIRIVVIDLLSPPAGVMMPAAPQLAMRGGSDGITTSVFHVDPYVISLSTMNTLNSESKQSIIGELIPTNGDENDFRSWTTFLWRAGNLLATSPVEEDSHFYFENVPIADDLHDLVFSGPKVEIHLQNLRLH